MTPASADIAVIYPTEPCRIIDDHDLFGDESQFFSLAEAVKILFASPGGKTQDAVGVYFKINYQGGRSRLLFYRFLGDCIEEEPVENDLYVRNVIFGSF